MPDNGLYPPRLPVAAPIHKTVSGLKTSPFSLWAWENVVEKHMGPC
jgi:hypothetical protein